MHRLVLGAYRSSLLSTPIVFMIRNMLDWGHCPAVERSPDKVSGAWVFKGTRIPVKALFENLEGGASIDDFVEWFPGVAREQIEAVLEHAEQSLAAV